MGAHNFVLIVSDNGEFEITGNQAVAGAGRVDHGALAEAAGFRQVFRFDDAREYAAAVPDVLTLPGPTFVHAVVEPGEEGPISRSASEEAGYLTVSLAESARTVRSALVR